MPGQIVEPCMWGSCDSVQARLHEAKKSPSACSLQGIVGMLLCMCGA
jgi:hypothetical protein